MTNNETHERNVARDRRELDRLVAFREKLKENLEHLHIFEDDYELEELDFGPPLTLGDIRFVYGLLWRAEDSLKAELPAKAA